MRPLLACVLYLAAAGSLNSPVFAGEVPIPSEYIGIWTFNTTVRDCNTQQILFQGARQDTICAGDTFDPSFGQQELDCTGTITATTIDAECTGTFVVDPECSANVHYLAEGNLSGDSWNMTITIDTDYVGTSCPIAHTCTSTISIGTRTNPNPDCGVQPVEPGTWGEIKHHYQD